MSSKIIGSVDAQKLTTNPPKADRLFQGPRLDRRLDVNTILGDRQCGQILLPCRTAKNRANKRGNRLTNPYANVFGSNLPERQLQRILEAGCNQVLHKPYQTHELFDAMAQHLGMRYRYEEEAEKPGSEPLEVRAEDIAVLPNAEQACGGDTACGHHLE
jgi:hypothetical protein